MAKTTKRAGRNSNVAASKTDRKIREDLYIYNEATAFVLTSAAMKGLEIQPGQPEWNERYQNGDFIPVELYQDDSFVIRVVVNDALTKQESDEWVGQISFKISIEDGKFLIAGGIEYLIENSEWTEENLTEYMQTVDVPNGVYKLDLYTYVTAPNGTPLIEIAEDGAREPMGKYFRRTHKLSSKKFPLWLKRWCIGYSAAEDPGHESEWKDLPYPEDQHYADFLVHLTPLTKDFSNPELVDEFISWNEMQCRKPEKCPLGLSSTSPKGWAPPVVTAPQYTYVDVWSALDKPEYVPQELLDSSLEVDPASIHHLYLVARCANSNVRTEFIIRGKNVQDREEQLKQLLPSEIEVLASQQGWLHIRFAQSGARWDTLGFSRLAGEAIGKLAWEDGTEFEVVSAVVDSEGNVADHAGLARIRGCLHNNSKLRVTHAHPELKVEDLSSALRMVAECESETGTTIHIDDERAANTAVALWKIQWQIIFKNNQPTVSNSQIVFQESERSAKHLLLEEYFVQRFATELNTRKPDWEAVEKLKRQKAFAEAEVVLDAGDRKFLQVSEAVISDDSFRKELQKIHQELLALGASPIGMLACTQFNGFVFAYYLMPDQISRYVWYQGGYTPSMSEVITDFADGAALSTMGHAGPTGDDPINKIFRSRYPKASVAELYRQHQERVPKLSEDHGDPLKFEPTLRECAQKFEQSIKRQSEG